MRSAPTALGVVVQCDNPAWAPLEAALGTEITSWFMWMHEIQLADGSRIHAYKHSATRRYLHLAGDGRAFEYRDADCHYSEVGLSTAIVRAFNGWERAQPPARHKRAMRAALQAARRLAA